MNNIRMLGSTALFRSRLSVRPDSVPLRALLSCERAVRSAFGIMSDIRPRLNEATVFSKESPCDWVTEADTKIQSEQIGNIIQDFPGHKIVAEEEHDEALDAKPSDRDVWYLDGVDGTAAFARKSENIFGKMDYLLPDFVQFGMQMSYLRDGVPMCAVFAAPAMNIDGLGYSVFEAVQGIDGTFLNGEPVGFGAEGRLQGAKAMLSLRGEPYEEALRTLFVQKGIGDRTVTRSVSSGSESCLLIRRPPELNNFNLIVSEREKPWDLIPGAFLIGKSGGSIRFIDGGDVFPFSFDLLGPDGRTKPVIAASLSNVSLALDIVKAFAQANALEV